MKESQRNNSLPSKALLQPALATLTQTQHGASLEHSILGIKLFCSAGSPFLISNKHLSPLCPITYLLDPFFLSCYLADRTYMAS